VFSALGYAVWASGGSNGGGGALAAVQRGPLTISVAETGTIQNRERVIVKSQVEGATTILSLVSEGTHVQKGDLLVELDSSRLQDDRTQQQISVQNAEASFIRARENLAVTTSQTESDIAQAELNSKFAQLDFQKYLEGEWPRQLQASESDITIAKEELQRAVDKLDWSRKLADEGFITRSELQADELASKRAQISLDLAEGSLNLLKDYTHTRTQEQLRSDVEQAEKALDRTKRKAAADIVQADADLKAKESEFKRQTAKLEKMTDQIAKCRIVAPVEGMVVYATTGQGGGHGNVAPLEEGQQVRERQELIHLPTTTAMTAQVKVHESSLRKVQVGLPVRVTADAVPGQVFWGHVAKIGILPDAQSAWMNPDLKVYDTQIDVDGDGSLLRVGMSCRAEIIVDQYEDALYVPLQSVVRVGDQLVAYVQTADGPQQRAIQVGLDNNRVIRVIGGLKEGEAVLLSPPLAPSEAPSEAQGKATSREVVPPRLTTQPGQTAVGATSQPATQAFDPSKLRDMTPEQRRAMLEQLTPEQREQMLRFRGGGGTGGRGGRGGGGAAGGGGGGGGGGAGGDDGGRRQGGPPAGGQ